MLPGPSEWLVIFGIIVLLFGASKLPKLGGAIGEGIKNFKKGLSSEDKEGTTSETQVAGKIGDKSKEKSENT